MDDDGNGDGDEVRIFSHDLIMTNGDDNDGDGDEKLFDVKMISYTNIDMPL